MLEKKIILKRNPFILFVMAMMPVLFTGCVITLAVFRLNLYLDKILCCIFFIFSIIQGIFSLRGNNVVLTFVENNLFVCENRKKNPKILKKISADEIRNIEVSPKEKRIFLELTDTIRYKLVDFKHVSIMGEEIFFQINAELCRFFPDKTGNIRDSVIENYLESGSIPESVKNKNQSGKIQAIFYTVLEIIVCIIPLNLGILSFLWVVTKIMILILSGMISGMINVLNFVSTL